MKKLFLFISLLLIFSYSYKGSDDYNSINIGNASMFDAHALDLFNSLSTEDLNFDLFTNALKGYYKLKGENKLAKASILTVVDFTKSANVPRLFIIDVEQRAIIHKSLVSHGRGSGDEYAKKFSNIPNTYQSSLGFYVTGETYVGQHGVSLRLDGMEKGFNDKARERGIVIHSAKYVNDEFIKNAGRLGRSHGCPALPEAGYDQIIDLIKDKSAFFIFYPEQNYLAKSEFVNNNDYLSYFNEYNFSN